MPVAWPKKNPKQNKTLQAFISTLLPLQKELLNLEMFCIPSSRGVKIINKSRWLLHGSL